MASFHDDTDYEKVKAKKCNFCLQNGNLMKNKPFCHKCAKKCFRECTRCHKPYDHEKYFELNEVRCNNCQRKYMKEREKREQKKLSTTLPIKKTSLISSSDDSTSDVERHARPVKMVEPPPVKKKRNMKKLMLPVYTVVSSDSCDE